MRRAGLLAAVMLLVAACSGDEPGGTSTSAPPSTTVRAARVESLGGDRPARLVVPPAWSENGPALPLVIVLHGYTASGRLQDAYLGVSGRGDELGFLTLTPDGTRDEYDNRFWNATNRGTGVDDTAYLIGLIDEAVRQYNADPARVYVVGHSNGGFMANRLACDAPDRITGIAALAGGIFGAESACDGAMNVVVIHGTDDRVVPFEGGALLGGRILGAEETVERWIAANGCRLPEPAGDAIDYDLLTPGDETSITVWTDCDSGRSVELWVMEGSGHVPGFRPAFRTALLQRLLEGR